MPDPAGRMSQSVRFKTSIQTKRNIKKSEMPTIYWIFLLPVPVDGQFSSGKSKSHTGLWKHRDFLCSQSACPFNRETKKKVIGGVVARSIGYPWPSPPFFNGGTLLFLVPCPVSENWVRVLHTLSQTLSGCLTQTSNECECYLNGYFQSINFFWNYCGIESQLPRNIALPSRCFYIMILECPQRPQSVMEFVKECQYSVWMEITEISTRSDSSGARA